MSDSKQNLGDRVRSLRLGGRTTDSPPRSRYLPWIVSFVLLLTTLAFGYRAYRVGTFPGTGSTAAVSPEQPVSPTTPAASASAAASGDVVLQAKGYVVPVSLVQVSPKVGGQIVFIAERFKEGALFQKDELLARIERIDYESEYNQALFAHEIAVERYAELKKTLPEEVKQAEADLEEARRLATQQELELKRNRRLIAGSAIAQRELEQSQFGYEATLARMDRLRASLRLIQEGRLERRLRQAEAEMRQARAALDKAKWRLDNTDIRAPVTGTILTKKAELGNIVNPSAFSSGISASLCEMANLRELEIDLSVQERDIASLRDGQPCLVMPEAYQADREFLARHPEGYHGQVRLMPTADRAKGAVLVRVRIDSSEISEQEAGKYLRPEMGALVTFRRAPTEKGTTSAARVTGQR